MREVCDETGMLIHPRDVLRVFHFTGPRKKKEYMYKFVALRDGELYALHAGTLDGTEAEGYFLWASAKQGKIKGTRILNRDPR